MVKVDDAFQVKYKHGKNEFQVLVDFDKLVEFKKKPQEISVYDVIADIKIFKDQKKGEIVSDNLLRESFGAKDEESIFKEILLKGECQIPTSFLNKIREEKKKQVINYIAENSLNPSNKGRYSYSMIEGEVNKIRYNFNPEQDFLPQAEDIIKLLKKNMPISIEKIILEISIPGRYCGNFYGSFKKLGNIKKEYFDSEGNLKIEIEITESLQDRVIDYIKKNSNNEGSYFIKKNI